MAGGKTATYDSGCQWLWGTEGVFPYILLGVTGLDTIFVDAFVSASDYAYFGDPDIPSGDPCDWSGELQLLGAYGDCDPAAICTVSPDD